MKVLPFSYAMKEKDFPKFKSFFWAGFECTYCKTEIKKRLDMLKETHHDRLVREDYEILRERGIYTVREGLAWHQIDNGTKRYDFSRFEKIMQAGKEFGIQQIWDLNHFDYPDYLDPFSEKFVKKFAEYARRAFHVIRKYQAGAIYIAPVNEISFFAWIAADRGAWAPYKRGRDNGFKFKRQLVRAALAAQDAIWREDGKARFIHIDPFMRRKAKQPVSEEASKHVSDFNEVVRFEAWDMLCGKTYPELGGHPKYLDIVGMNYYFHNQEWVISKKRGGLGFGAMEWHSRARVSFADMVEEVYNRYRRPVLISETGSYGALRFRWWNRVLREIDDGIRKGLPICGVCAYPAIDRPDHINYLIPQSGLWDFEPGDKHFTRHPHTKTLNAIENYITKGAINYI
jgi:beta-glucosidase/6-phospho-beta-glucosidase/beta-galactosidase